MSVRLHKKFGFNPTISQCILCGKSKNQIALLGASYKEEAPMNMVTEVEPCDECKKKYLSKGVMMVEATKELNGFHPTGKIAVIKDKFFKKAFKGTSIPSRKIAFTEIGVLERMGVLKEKMKKEAKAWK